MHLIVRAMAAALIVVVLPWSAGAGHTKQRAVARTYSTPTPLLEPACYLTPSVRPVVADATGQELDDRATADLGGACVRVRTNETFVTLQLIDEMGWTVSATVYFRDEVGNYIDDAQYGLCGGGTIAMPDAAWSMVVTAEASNVWCLTRDAAMGSGPATTGTIVATFLRV